MPQAFVPIQFDKPHLSTIGERLYTQSLDLIRELVANAYDADASIVKISIENNLIVVEDNGLGMDREGVRQYFTIGSGFKRQNPISPKFKRVRIGEFGIGKFAVLSICDRFEIYTRSQTYAATLIFDKNDFETRNDWNIPLIEHTVEISNTGTRVSLFHVKKPISLFDVERHLINVFPLSDKDFSLFLNGQKLQSKYIAGERFRILHKAKALFAMREFQILDRVRFDYGGEQKVGTVTRLNQKTITVTLDNGQRWNVSPSLLTKIDEKNPLDEFIPKERTKH